MFVNPPDEFVSVLGGTASFSCITSPGSNDLITSVQWLVNDTLLENLGLENVVTTLGQLRFRMLSEYNNHTSIRCRASLISGTVSTSRDATILLIQGLFMRPSPLLGL